MSDKLKIGVIGAGMIGDVHISNIQKDGRGEVTWIATRTQETLDKKLKQFNILNGTLDYKEMLADDTLNVVIIATPPHLHFPVLKDALEAGKDVVLEKPLALNVKEIDASVELVAQYPDRTVVECSCRHARLQPRFRMIKAMIDKGDLGEIYYIHHTQLGRGTFIEYNPAGAWAHQKAYSGGGPIIDWGVYDLSFHLGLLNDKPQIKSIKSITKNGMKKFPDPNFISDVEEHGVAYLEFDNGLTYHYERGSGVHFETPNETRIFGTKGGLKFGFCTWDDPKVEFFTYDDDGKEVTKELQFDSEGHDDNFEFIKHFMDCFVDGVEPQMTVGLAAKHLKILFEILK